MTAAIDKLRCPLCKGGLELDNKSYNRTIKCGQNHCFDFAKQGYLNLLPANQKQSKDPGDGPEMIQARDRFHAAGHYQLLGKAVAEHLDTDASLLDLGCGEGSYGDWILQEDPSRCYYGLDISRHGIKRAASKLKKYASKQQVQPTCIVASNFALPIQDHCFDHALSIFAPVSEDELARVLNAGGSWINITPGSNHLKQLRSALYDDVRDIDKQKQFERWKLSKEESLCYNVTLNPTDIADLLTMTPYAWQASQAKRNALCELASLDLSIDFKLSRYQLKP